MTENVKKIDEEIAAWRRKADAAKEKLLEAQEEIKRLLAERADSVAAAKYATKE